MKHEDLTPEQRTKAKACKTPEDLLALAKKEGYELSVEQLEEVAGGLSPARVPQATEGGAAAFAHASPQGDRVPSLESVRRLRENRRLHV